MKERGIIMNDEMARAVWEGRKTQTRRPVKQCKQFADWDATPGMAYDVIASNSGQFSFLVAGDHGFTDDIAPPYGQPGDRLWIRECFGMVGQGDAIHYRATEPDYEIRHATNWYDRGFRWRPSIHMPRWAARSVREIVAVRVERVQDISEADAMAEGLVESDLGRLASHLLRCYKGEDRPPLVLQFADLWTSIYGGADFAWENNPWVWVYEFKKMEESK